jgi:hypothetical protein
VIRLDLDCPRLATLHDRRGLAGSHRLGAAVGAQPFVVANDDQAEREGGKQRQADDTHQWAGKQGRQSLHSGSGRRSVRGPARKSKE